MSALSRRGILGTLAAVPAFGVAGRASASPAQGADAELLALERALDLVVDAINERRELFQPLEDRFIAIMDENGRTGTSIEAAMKFQTQSGLGEMVEAENRLYANGDAIWAKMVKLPAATDIGRAAKVRAFLGFVVPEWEDAGADLDYPNCDIRRLLVEFAGMEASHA